jgi:cholecystokinin A receptor
LFFQARKKVSQGGGSMASGSSPSASSKVDSNWLANLKTAGMLFVVTVVFVVTYLPAFLMAMFVVPYNIIVFYLYFANNVANPVIYSFMNQVLVLIE